MKRAIVLGAILLLSGLPFLTEGKTVEELKQELNEKREELQSTQERIEKFREDIQLKKREARTLEDQINLIDSDINEIELNISRTLTEIEAVAIEIEKVNEEINEREAEIVIQKGRLAGYIRQLHQLDQQSSVAIFLKYQSFAEAIQEAQTFEELQKRGHETLISIQQLRDELQTKKQEMEDFRETLEALERRQEAEQARLAANRESKERILNLTNEQEAQFQQLLSSAQATHQTAQAEIKRLDSQIREELKKQGVGSLPSVGSMSPPIEAVFGVSCEWHCPGYPYEYLIGPHTGIDIPANVGTPVRAPADGYVARVHDSGGPGYSYVMIIHGDNITTVYGHLSGFAANEGQFVSQGTTIGFTGGAPGMRGAGLSSGPHLHFEVREDGRPINPRIYLGSSYGS